MSSQASTPQNLELKKTPLFSSHEKAGARFTEFGGWNMPVQYSGLSEEHHAVRKHVGLFDVSHMGEMAVRGPQALEFLQYVSSNNVSKLTPGRAQYTLLLNPKGGVVDDIIIYQIAEDDYFLCVNAANTAKDFSWLTKNNTFETALEDVSAQFAQLAVQGPYARALMGDVLQISDDSYSPENFSPFTFRPQVVDLEGAPNSELIVCCTGYTGEDGFEVFCAPEISPLLWQELLEQGQKYQIQPVGLGARDTLRLEVCYPLHGHELTDDLCALGCGVDWVIKLKKGDFIGRDALLKQKEEGIKQTLVGIEVMDRGIVRAENRIYQGDAEVGWVSSGTKTPTVNKAIGLAFVTPDFSEPGTELEAEVRGRRLAVKVVEKPFYRRN